MNITRRLDRFQAKRKAISGIIGAVLLFAMIGTVGTSYFLYINSANTLVNKALTDASDRAANRIQEAAIITTAMLPGNSHVLYYLNNTGGISINITSSFLIDPSGKIVKCYIFETNAPNSCANTGSHKQTPVLPLYATPGRGLPLPKAGTSGYVDTGISLTGSNATWTVTLKLTSARGTVFIGSYPNAAVPVAKLAITTQGAGFLALNFNSYVYYTCTSTCGVNSVMSPWPAGTAAYSLPASKASVAVFAASVTNVDPDKRTVILYQQTRLTQIIYSGGSNTKNNFWQIGNVDSNGKITGQLSSYSPITLSYGQTLTLYFTAIGSTNQGNLPSSGDFVQVFILLYGTIGTGSSYGQNIPFVTTLYT